MDNNIRKPSVADRIIEGLNSALSGEPVKQTVVRRMIVKGKTKFVHESFKAPVFRRANKGRD